MDGTAEPHPQSSVPCGANVVMNLVGSKWKPTILWRLAEGDHRFAELRRATAGISEKVLAAQLKELERDGLVVREAHPGFPLRVDYRLTEQGAELNHLLDPVAQWGDRYHAAGGGRVMISNGVLTARPTVTPPHRRTASAGSSP